jgi:hypothetical protein
VQRYYRTLRPLLGERKISPQTPSGCPKSAKQIRTSDQHHYRIDRVMLMATLPFVASTARRRHASPRDPMHQDVCRLNLHQDESLSWTIDQ